MKRVIYAVFCALLSTSLCYSQSLLDSVYHNQKLKKHLKAISLCEQLLDGDEFSNKEKSDIFFAMGYSFKNLNQPSNAIKFYLLSVEAYNEPICHGRAHYNIGNIYKDFQHYSQAIEHYNIAISLTENRAKRGKYLVSRAIARKYNDELADALNDVLNAQEIALEDVEKNKVLLHKAYNQRGLIKMAIGNYDEALQYFDYANELNDKLNTYVNIGLCYVEGGEDQKAIGAFNRALLSKQHSSQKFKSYQALGEIYSRLEENDEALKFLQRSEERRVGKECRSRWSPYH